MEAPKQFFDDLNEDLVTKIIKLVLKDYSYNPRTSQALGNTSKAFHKAVINVKSAMLPDIIPTSDTFKEYFRTLLLPKNNRDVPDINELTTRIEHLNDYTQYEMYITDDDDVDDDILGYLADEARDPDAFEEAEPFVTTIRNRIIAICESLSDKLQTGYEGRVAQDYTYIYHLGVLYYHKSIFSTGTDLIKSIEFHKAHLTAIITNKNIERMYLAESIAFIEKYSTDVNMKRCMCYMYYHITKEVLYNNEPEFALQTNNPREVYETCVEYFLSKN